MVNFYPYVIFTTDYLIASYSDIVERLHLLLYGVLDENGILNAHRKNKQTSICYSVQPGRNAMLRYSVDKCRRQSACDMRSQYKRDKTQTHRTQELIRTKYRTAGFICSVCYSSANEHETLNSILFILFTVDNAIYRP